jgi:chromate transport protein ChrA
VKVRQALGRGGFVAAACVACCAPPIIAALGVTAGLAATAGIFLGLAAAIAVVLIGGAWILARTRRHSGRSESEPNAVPVPVAAPTRRDIP